MLQIQAIGNLGGDPEMRYTADGKAVTSFRLACRNGKGTTWLTVTCWDKLGELVNQFTEKGSKVAVLGRLTLEEYESRDGGKRTAVKVIASEVEFLSGKGHQADDGGEGEDLATATGHTPYVEPTSREGIAAAVAGTAAGAAMATVPTVEESEEVPF